MEYSVLKLLENALLAVFEEGYAGPGELLMVSFVPLLILGVCFLCAPFARASTPRAKAR